MRFGDICFCRGYYCRGVWYCRNFFNEINDVGQGATQKKSRSLHPDRVAYSLASLVS
jgi:hypothetical protein